MKKNISLIAILLASLAGSSAQAGLIYRIQLLPKKVDAKLGLGIFSKNKNVDNKSHMYHRVRENNNTKISKGVIAGTAAAIGIAVAGLGFAAKKGKLEGLKKRFARRK